MANTALNNFLSAKNFSSAKENTLLGMDEYNLGNYQNALRAFDRAIRSNCQYFFAFAFLYRGLTYMKLGRLEYAVKDFTSSIYYKGDAPDPYYWRAITYEKQNPGYHALQRGWSDIYYAVELTPDGKHPAHKLLPRWRKKLFDKGFFPYLYYPGFQRDFSRKFKVLYHVVPERYDSFFRKGILAFRSLSNLRSSNEDPQEGVSEDEIREGRHHITIANEMEAFTFCFSKWPEIKDVRGGVLYRVNTKKFMSALIKGFDALKIPAGMGKRDFLTGKHDPNKKVTFMPSAGQVTYRKRMDNMLSSFVKGERFLPEQEVRIVLEIMSEKGEKVGDKGYRYRTLTTDNPIIEVKINPDGCFHRMEELLPIAARKHR